LYKEIREASDSTEELLAKVGLKDDADKQSKSYSGGMKRKLCLANAFIGKPKIVFLDEPSSGMDPVSRRAMWDLIAQLKENRVVILTTHFLAEAEAICDKIAIMINGAIRCIGNIQYLKNKFGGSYKLQITTADDVAKAQTHQFLMANIPNIQKSNMIGSTDEYEIPKVDNFSLAEIFAKIEQHKQELGIVDYLLSQSTIEQIFLEFVREQNEEEVQ